MPAGIVTAQSFGEKPASVTNVPLKSSVTEKEPSACGVTMYVRVNVSVAQSLPQTEESGDPESYGPKTSGELMPLAPVGPVAPAGPCAPVGPAGPWEPCKPVAPVAPAGPCAPVAPAGPVGPCGPATPAAPIDSVPAPGVSVMLAPATRVRSPACPFRLLTTPRGE